jgi:hypothetical protein
LPRPFNGRTAWGYKLEKQKSPLQSEIEKSQQYRVASLSEQEDEQ